MIIPKHKQHEKLLLHVLGNSSIDHTAVLFSTRLCFAKILKISLVLVEPNPATFNTADSPITSVMFICLQC